MLKSNAYCILCCSTQFFFPRPSLSVISSPPHIYLVHKQCSSNMENPRFFNDMPFSHLFRRFASGYIWSCKRFRSWGYDQYIESKLKEKQYSYFNTKESNRSDQAASKSFLLTVRLNQTYKCLTYPSLQHSNQLTIQLPKELWYVEEHVISLEQLQLAQTFSQLHYTTNLSHRLTPITTIASTK